MMREQEKILNLAVEKILNYLEENQNPATPVVNYQSANLLQENFDLSLPEKGIGLEESIPIIESYLNHTTRTSSPKFFNQLWGGFEITGLLAEMVTSAANTSMYTYEVAPVATLIELKLIETLNNIIGFNNGEGVMVTGGTNANMIAMLCARNKFVPEAKKDGLDDKKLVAFVSDKSHYSFLKAANLLGIGTSNIIKVKSDIRNRMDVNALESAIQLAIIDGKTPFFVGATAGTTVAGAFDPLLDIAEVTKKYNIWLHVDGSWGGPVLLSEKHKHLLTGSELADSFAWDAHKLMGVPLICSFLLVKEKGTLFEVCSSGGTDYIFHDDENYSYDLGKISLQCGRKVDALKLWLSWKCYGTSGYGARIDRLFELTRYVTEYIRDSPDLELLIEPEFVNICFRYHPANGNFSAKELDSINLEIREKLMRSGQALVNYANYNGQMAIRLILANPEITEKDLDGFFSSFIQAAIAITKS